MSDSKNKEQTSVDKKETVSWPTTPSALVIMGKRQGTKKENKQLKGRIAMGAALWHSAPDPKPYLAFVASDCHGPYHRPDTEIVKHLLVNEFEIHPDFLILRQRSNCTLVEVRAIRTLTRVYGLTHIFALTHLYHAPRAQQYLDEVLSDATVIPVHPTILDEINFPILYEDIFPRLKSLIKDSQPKRLDYLREMMVEWVLTQAHKWDPRGRLERKLAKLLRPGVR